MTDQTIPIEKIEEILDDEYAFSWEKLDRISDLIREARAPKPKDVPSNEAWIVKIKDTQEEVVGFRNPWIDGEFPWVVNRATWTLSPARYSDDGITLVKRLVPEEEEASSPTTGTILFSEKDYLNAPIGTRVTHSFTGVEYTKTINGMWKSKGSGGLYLTSELAGFPRKVVKE